MSLASGARIGVYEIVGQLGAGGMGEVYRAHDTRLGRDVALKVLPDLFTHDSERLARFEREAKVLASLNHPNIAQVYGFEPPSGASKQAAIAMELVEGQTLHDLLRSHASETGAAGLPLDRALALARQIATALEAAHDQGVVHRDLKPANVSVREDGTVKVLDFGLAKAFAADAESAQSAVAHSPTLTARSTQLGMILGTAAYMSPEQAKGRAVDRRADVWAFGAVLFEMLAGHRAFEGDDVSDVLASVLKTDPDWTLLPADLPAPVRRLLRRCLEKDPKKRLRDVAEGMLQLDEGLAAGATSSGAPQVAAAPAAGRLPVWRRAAPVAITAVATAVIVASIGMLSMPSRSAPPVVLRTLHSTQEHAPLFSTQVHRDVSISPDGRLLAYTAGGGGSPSVYLRQLNQLEAVPLRGAENGAIAPFFSADGQWVGFIEQRTQTNLKKVSILGGPAVLVTMSESQIVGATWAEDHTIIFGSREGPLRTVPDGGGQPEPLTTVDTAQAEVEHVWPYAVPNSGIVLFTVGSRTGGVFTRKLAALDRRSGRIARLDVLGSHPRYLPSGHVVYSSEDSTLRAMAFDLGSMTVSGSSMPVLEGVGTKVSGAANFDVSADGHLVHTAAGIGGMVMRTLAWTDRAGRETPINAPARNYFYARVSPDGTRLSLDVRDEEEDIWIWELERETMTRLTARAGSDQYGVWTPDHHVIFSSPNGVRAELFRQRPDAVGEPERMTDTSAYAFTPFPNAVTPDGKHVIFRGAVDGPKSDLFVGDLDGSKKVRTLLGTPHSELNAAMSPDGRYVAFESDVTGTPEVFVRPFPNVEEAQYQVSTGGGTEAVWSPDGREIFYVADGKLVTVPVTLGTPLRLGKPTPLFDVAPYFFGGVGRNYDVAPDGKRFVMVKNPAERQSRSFPVTIVLNWVEELRARVPPR